ncbi:MAG: hypothetical protein KJ601_02020, partial [Nanoarchaeota archaeon]|nr:hypothetical protein [Nanoarchaeota archaeon]MBU1704229.1 hypothetical protein [Nanoarchaeota archaeon]
MALDTAELSKLSLKERLKRLKEIEEERKKEIAEAEQLIKETQTEINEEQISSKIAIPDAKKIDIAALFEKGEGIEAIAKEAPNEFENAVKYQVMQDYETLVSMYNRADPETLARLDEIGERLEKVSYHVESEAIANKVVASIAL